MVKIETVALWKPLGRGQFKTGPFNSHYEEDSSFVASWTWVLFGEDALRETSYPELFTLEEGM